MPKLKNKPPKYAKLKNYAVVYFQGRTHYLGLYGSPESKTAYARFVAESRVDPIFAPPQEGEKITIADLVAAFLEHAKPTLDPATFGHYPVARTVQFKMDFFEGWLQEQSERDRAIILDLATGETTGDVARKYNVSDGLISGGGRHLLDRKRRSISYERFLHK